MAQEYPTRWQRKTLWNAITLAALISIGAMVALLLWLGGQVLGFLQPVLIPVAVAGVLAYLLEPVVAWLCQRGMSRLSATLVLFAGLAIGLLLLGASVVPPLYAQSQRLIQSMPEYWQQAQDLFADPEEGLEALEEAGERQAPGSVQRVKEFWERHGDSPVAQHGVDWLQEKLPTFAEQLWGFLQRSVGGVLGAFAFFLSMLIVPVYLFFFIYNAPAIAGGWAEYLPLRASRFKDDIVGTLREINGYIIAFFRGQLLVSIIDGVLTTIVLLLMGMDFAIVIGVMVATLGLIPYLGILLCWIPAVLIATVQWDGWVNPFTVTIAFLLIQNFDGWVIAPRIIGDSVGLHPFTVIISVFAWSLLIGGLLGAILAVPLTATLKVLLRRYVWGKDPDALQKEPRRRRRRRGGGGGPGEGGRPDPAMA